MLSLIPKRILTFVFLNLESALDFYKRFREYSVASDYEILVTDFQQAYFPSTNDKQHEIIALDFSCLLSKDFAFSEIELMHSTWIIMDKTGIQVELHCVYLR